MKICKCIPETASVQETAVGILIRACANEWDEARNELNNVLFPAVQKLEFCLPPEEYLEKAYNTLDAIDDAIDDHNIKAIGGLTRGITKNLPIDICEKLGSRLEYFTMTGRTNLEEEHTVVFDPEAKTATCNCDGFYYRGDCNHVKYYKKCFRKIK